MTQDLFPKLLQILVKKQPSMQLKAVGSIGARQPALEENANTTLTTASTKNKTVLLKWTGWHQPVKTNL